jgi:hypothetical protein
MISTPWNCCIHWLDFFYGATFHSGPGPPHFRRSTITLRHTTLSRTPPGEWSARRRDLYLTTHNAQKRQTSKPPAGFEPLRVVAFPRLKTARRLGSAPLAGMQTCIIAVDVNRYMLPFDWLDSCLLFSWKKKDMISKPSSDHGRQLTSPTGLRTIYLSRGRKTIWFWRLRVAVDENWHLLWNLKHIDRRLSLV